MTHIKTVTVSSKGQIVIPEDIRNELAISEGTQLVLLESGGKLILEKDSRVISKMKKLTDEELERMGWLLVAESSLSKDWLSKQEDDAWKNL